MINKLLSYIGFQISRVGKPIIIYEVSDAYCKYRLEYIPKKDIVRYESKGSIFNNNINNTFYQLENKLTKVCRMNKEQGYTMFTYEQNYAYESIKLYTVTENSNTEVIMWHSEGGICGETIYDHIKIVLTEIQSEYQSILVTTKNL